MTDSCVRQTAVFAMPDMCVCVSVTGQSILPCETCVHHARVFYHVRHVCIMPEYFAVPDVCSISEYFDMWDMCVCVHHARVFCSARHVQHFRVFCHVRHVCVCSMPEYFAVPNCLTNADVTKAAEQYRQGRLPVMLHRLVCWTHLYGDLTISGFISAEGLGTTNPASADRYR